MPLTNTLLEKLKTFWRDCTVAASTVKTQISKTSAEHIKAFFPNCSLKTPAVAYKYLYISYLSSQKNVCKWKIYWWAGLIIEVFSHFLLKFKFAIVGVIWKGWLHDLSVRSEPTYRYGHIHLYYSSCNGLIKNTKDGLVVKTEIRNNTTLCKCISILLFYRTCQGLVQNSRIKIFHIKFGTENFNLFARASCVDFWDIVKGILWYYTFLPFISLFSN